MIKPTNNIAFRAGPDIAACLRGSHPGGLELEIFKIHLLGVDYSK